MFRIAFITYAAQLEIAVDDQLVLPFLSGCEVRGIPWDAKNVEWETFDAVILRSCWDYHLRLNEFLKWLDELEKKKVKIFNSPTVIRENSDKCYLKKIADAGIQTIPTVWFDRHSPVDFYDVLQSRNWQQAVVKPAVSATAYQTWIASPAAADREERIIEKMLEDSDVLVQPFIGEIVNKGEWSFVFFDKKYSHSALKRAKTGDFRVQLQFGGYLADTPPPQHLIEQAEEVLNLVAEDLLYARVDGVEIDGKFNLMEFELIEPNLFLINSPAAPKKFAEAILAKL